MNRIVIDAHVHPQHFTPGFLKEGERFTYDKLENAIMSELPFYNSPSSLAMRNEMVYEQMQRYPNRFIGFCDFVDTARAEWSGEAEFDPQKAAEEVDFWLSNDFTGLGELPGTLPDKKRRLSIDENTYLPRPILEVCQAHEAPVLFHTEPTTAAFALPSALPPSLTYPAPASRSRDTLPAWRRHPLICVVPRRRWPQCNCPRSGRTGKPAPRS